MRHWKKSTMFMNLDVIFHFRIVCVELYYMILASLDYYFFTDSFLNEVHINFLNLFYFQKFYVPFLLILLSCSKDNCISMNFCDIHHVILKDSCTHSLRTCWTVFIQVCVMVLLVPLSYRESKQWFFLAVNYSCLFWVCIYLHDI